MLVVLENGRLKNINNNNIKKSFGIISACIIYNTFYIYFSINFYNFG